MKSCEYCIAQETCTRNTGIIFGGCNVDFDPDTERIYKRLDNLEDCKDNSVYVAEIRELRSMLL